MTRQGFPTAIELSGICSVTTQLQAEKLYFQLVTNHAQ